MTMTDISARVDMLRNALPRGKDERAQHRTADAILHAASQALLHIPEDTSPDGAVNKRALDLLGDILDPIKAATEG